MGDLNTSMFKPVFGQQWENLPEIIKKRYANRAHSNDLVTVEGRLDISFSKVMAFFMPLFKLFKVLVPYQGKDIPVTVNFQSSPEGTGVSFDRTFSFPGKKPCYFRSYLQPIKDDEVIEFVCLGLGWKMKFAYKDNKVLLQHDGFAWKIFGKIIPIPLGFLMGNIYAEEEVLSDDSFRMMMKITHPLLGTVFEYGGKFKLVYSP